jgi:hypothetical protein
MELDDYFSRLRAEPVPDLSAIDGARLAKRAGNERRQGRMVLTTAAVAALLVGMVGGLPAPTVSATAVPFGPPASLMPLAQLGRG